MSDSGDSSSVSPEGWEPMASAPRDHSFLIVRLAPGRRGRKHDEHIARWDGSGLARGFWRSSTIRGLLLREDHCTGWRPLDEPAREFLRRQRERSRAQDRALRARRARGGPG